MSSSPINMMKLSLKKVNLFRKTTYRLKLKYRQYRNSYNRIKTTAKREYYKGQLCYFKDNIRKLGPILTTHWKDQ